MNNIIKFFLVVVIPFLPFPSWSKDLDFQSIKNDLSGMCLDNLEVGCQGRYLPFRGLKIDFCEETCSLTNPVDLKEINATTYDFECVADYTTPSFALPPPSERNPNIEAGYYDSPEYKGFMKNQAGGVGTLDVRFSPYFGRQNSGSIGVAADAAYEAYLNSSGNTGFLQGGDQFKQAEDYIAPQIGFPGEGFSDSPGLGGGLTSSRGGLFPPSPFLSRVLLISTNNQSGDSELMFVRSYFLRNTGSSQVRISGQMWSVVNCY